ncbi:hypothetical protein [Acidisphaera sp. L21]|uniref:hypothetical protein n=1 Tax=Acidisphaera sp. L21 TaxID=1641851 RepID=UPI00131AB5E9|nr:hypothetical protein [Acidisphaera sp. L21]
MSQTTVPRDLQYSLAQASEAKMVRVVSMVDAMADRGAADDLLVPLRSRLAVLRPARPLRFSRLLFLPLDAIIVPAAQWRVGLELIPRSAIPPLTAVVQAGLAGAADIEAMIVGRSCGETEIEAQAGRRLWSAAADVLTGLDTCPGWGAATALPDHAWQEIRAKVAGVLLIADRIWGEEPPAFASDAAMAALLNDVQQHAPLAMNAVLAVLLALGKDSARVLRAASRHSDRVAGLGRAALARALDALPEVVANRIGRASVDDAADEADRVDAFLTAAEASGSIGRAEIRAARFEAAAQCADRFANGVASELIPPAVAYGAMPSDEEIMEAEGIARSLARIERAGRSMGGETQFDAASADAQALLCSLGPAEMEAVDRARLAEILFGPDQAEQLMRSTC